MRLSGTSKGGAAGSEDRRSTNSDLVASREKWQIWLAILAMELAKLSGSAEAGVTELPCAVAVLLLLLLLAHCADGPCAKLDLIVHGDLALSGELARGTADAAAEEAVAEAAQVLGACRRKAGS